MLSAVTFGLPSLCPLARAFTSPDFIRSTIKFLSNSENTPNHFQHSVQS